MPQCLCPATGGDWESAWLPLGIVCPPVQPGEPEGLTLHPGRGVCPARCCSARGPPAGDLGSPGEGTEGPQGGRPLLPWLCSSHRRQRRDRRRGWGWAHLHPGQPLAVGDQLLLGQQQHGVDAARRDALREAGESHRHSPRETHGRARAGWPRSAEAGELMTEVKAPALAAVGNGKGSLGP